MTPLALVVAGLVALVAGALLLRQSGTAWRIGRLLAVAPQTSLDEALALALAGNAPRYVRVNGRIASEEEFPDEHDRPLVYRRQRLQVQHGRSWSDLSDERLAVPFGIEDRQAFLGIDVDALGEGLVVIPRVATGTAADLPPNTLTGTVTPPPGAVVRLRIDQVSAVEHASAAGVPVLGASGEPILTSGTGRPLILTTLEPSAAMRVLASGQRGRMVLAAALLVAGLGLLAAGAVAWLVRLSSRARWPAAVAFAAWLLVGSVSGPVVVAGAAPNEGVSPAATPAVIGTGDPRSDGEGPGLQGSPLLIAFGVLSIGMVAAAATVLFLRLRRPD